MITLVLASILVSVPRHPVVSDEFAKVFEAHEYPVGQKDRITYRLFVPRNLKPTERCPLLLWLHGAGEGGLDNHFNLRYLPLVIKDLEHLVPLSNLC